MIKWVHLTPTQKQHPSTRLDHGDEYHGNEWMRISSERGWTRHRMSLIESRNNPVSLTKGMLYDVRSNRCWYPECTGVIMGIQVPLMIIDRSLISVMTGVFSDRRVTHLRARWNRRPFRNYRSYRRMRENSEIGSEGRRKSSVVSELFGKLFRYVLLFN